MCIFIYITKINMKKCSKCEIEKDESNFFFKNKEKNPWRQVVPRKDVFVSKAAVKRKTKIKKAKKKVHNGTSQRVHTAGTAFAYSDFNR